MRLTSLVIALLLIVIAAGFVVMYGRIDEWDGIRIEIGAATDEADAPPTRLPLGRSRAVLASSGFDFVLEFDRPTRSDLPVVFLLGGNDREAKARLEAFAASLPPEFTTVRIRDHGATEEQRSWILLDSFAFVKRIANVDRDRFAVIAFAPAAPYALVAAALTPEVRVIAVHDPIMPNGLTTDLAAGLPRTLLVVDEAEAGSVATRHTLESMLRKHGIPYDVRLQSNPASAIEDAWSLMSAFVTEYLPAS